MAIGDARKTIRTSNVASHDRYSDSWTIISKRKDINTPIASRIRNWTKSRSLRMHQTTRTIPPMAADRRRTHRIADINLFLHPSFTTLSIQMGFKVNRITGELLAAFPVHLVDNTQHQDRPSDAIKDIPITRWSAS